MQKNKKQIDIKFPPKPHFANVTHLNHFISCAGDKSGFKIIRMKKKKKKKREKVYKCAKAGFFLT